MVDYLEIQTIYRIQVIQLPNEEWQNVIDKGGNVRLWTSAMETVTFARKHLELVDNWRVIQTTTTETVLVNNF